MSLSRRVERIEQRMPPQPDMALIRSILERARTRDPQVIGADGSVDLARLTDDELERLYRAYGGKEEA